MEQGAGTTASAGTAVAAAGTAASAGTTTASASARSTRYAGLAWELPDVDLDAAGLAFTASWLQMQVLWVTAAVTGACALCMPAGSPAKRAAPPRRHRLAASCAPGCPVQVHLDFAASLQLQLDEEDQDAMPAWVDACQDELLQVGGRRLGGLGPAALGLAVWVSKGLWIRSLGRPEPGISALLWMVVLTRSLDPDRAGAPGRRRGRVC
jgi:hypothetical protein